MADDAPDGLEEATAELYGLDPKDFVPARNELARTLRKAGDRALAAEVAKLRRPSPAAWAVNQLGRRYRSDLEELVGLGQALRAAQDGALSGAEPGEMRTAGRARRDAVSRLAGLAEALLEERGGGAGAHAREVASTLEAASLDEEAAAAVLRGRLSEELEPPSGFGVFDGALVAPDRPRPVREPEPELDDRELREAEDAAAEAKGNWEERSARARSALDKVAERRRAVETEEAEIERLEGLIEDARRRLGRAAREAEQAEDAASRAEDAVAKAAARLREAGQRVAELGGG
ncbi:MAG: hypothetical protein ACR2KK_08885 [Acidimicrobiales bacterium]